MYCVNETLAKREFPDPLKLSNMVPLHKKEDPTNIMNYKFVSVLQLLLKVFEKMMYELIILRQDLRRCFIFLRMLLIFEGPVLAKFNANL